MNKTIEESFKATCLVGMQRRIEVWRPIKNCTPEQLKDAKHIQIARGRKKALIEVDDKFIDIKDLVVNGGLNALCGQTFDSSGSRPAVFNYVAIGEDSTAPSATQTDLGSEAMRVQGTYAKDANVGECSMDGTFDIDGTYALYECGLFNDPSAGTMYCRDTYPVKNVISGDTVKVYYTPKFQVP